MKCALTAVLVGGLMVPWLGGTPASATTFGTKLGHDLRLTAASTGLPIDCTWLNSAGLSYGMNPAPWLVVDATAEYFSALSVCTDRGSPLTSGKLVSTGLDFRIRPFHLEDGKNVSDLGHALSIGAGVHLLLVVESTMPGQDTLREVSPQLSLAYEYRNVPWSFLAGMSLMYATESAQFYPVVRLGFGAAF